MGLGNRTPAVGRELLTTNDPGVLVAGSRPVARSGNHRPAPVFLS